MERLNKLKAKLPPTLYEILVVIINRGQADTVTEFLRTSDLPLSMISFGDGTAPSNLYNVLNYSQEKEVVFAMVDIANSTKVLDLLEKEILSAQKNAGIAFTIPLKSITSNTIDAINLAKKTARKRSKK